MKFLASAAVAVIASSAFGASPAPDAPTLSFVWGPELNMESGVVSVTSAGRGLFFYDSYTRGLVQLDETQPAGKAAAIFGRALKGVFIDVPLAETQTLLIHEVFGHGARGRESGLTPSYRFHLVAPYSWILGEAPGPTGYTIDARSGQLERDLPMTAAGLESNYLTAWWINRQVFARSGSMHYSEMLLYVGSKLTYASDLFSDLSRPLANPEDAGDPHTYVAELQNRFNLWQPGERERVARNLRRAYWANYLDSTFWLSVYHGFVTYGFRGERDAKLPMLSIGPLELFPATRFNLSPFGAEHYLEVFGRAGAPFFDIYARGGSSGLASYWGAGASVDDLRVAKGLIAGAELDAWWQPQTIFEARNVFDRDNRAGLSVAARARWLVYRQLGLVGKLAYKSRGYLMGQPLSEGLYGFVGLTVAPSDADYALVQ